MRAHNAVSPDEYEKRIREKCVSLGYTFVRFDSEWKGNKTKFFIECPEHGVFSSSISNFLSLGRKCTKCTKTYRYSQSEREIQIGTILTNSTYSFVGWATKYQNHKSKAVLDCVEHGCFEVSVNDLMNGVRCAKCNGRYVYSPKERELQVRTLCENSGFTFVRWVERYKNTDSRAIFRCSKHGEWECRVDNFVNKGTRCPKCCHFGFDVSKPGTLYALLSQDEKLIKIGVTNKFKRRLYELKRDTPFSFRVHKEFQCDGKTILSIEKFFHAHFESSLLTGFDGATEWLYYSDKIQFVLDLLRNENEST